MADDTNYAHQHSDRDDLGTEDVFAADNISDVLYPRHKLSIGNDGLASDVSNTNPMPVGSEVLTEIRDTLVKIERQLSYLSDREVE